MQVRYLHIIEAHHGGNLYAGGKCFKPIMELRRVPARISFSELLCNVREPARSFFACSIEPGYYCLKAEELFAYVTICGFVRVLHFLDVLWV